MSYREINLRSTSADTAATEAMYEIAACRADNVELIRFNIPYGITAESMTEGKKIFSSLIRLFKNMKQRGSIQFIATAKSFESGSTESSFLYNKYSDLLEGLDVIESVENYIFVKL